MPASRRKLFRVVTLMIVIVGGCLIGEIALRYRQAHIRDSDQLDPGMTRYDAQLGWTLTPNWKGKHRHYDFDVGYSINAMGFRRQPNEETRRSAETQVIGVVGDSFTFGFGVNDDETFVSRLNVEAGDLGWFANLGVPGYSTDQECLLVERDQAWLGLDAILLVVYLGNDLLDNQWPFPIQGNVGKPYFVLEASGLVLNNSPVSRKRKDPGEFPGDLGAALFQGSETAGGLPGSVVRRSELLRSVVGSQHSEPSWSESDDVRLEAPWRLGEAILERLLNGCRGQGIRLTLVLMPGRSFVVEPDGLSARVQDRFRGRLVEFGSRQGVAVIDLAGAMRTASMEPQQAWFYENEGHLTPLGHRKVAAYLGEEFNRRKIL